MVFFLLQLKGNTSHATLSGSDLLFSKDSSPYGIPFSEWISKWWQWHVSLQNKVDPLDINNLSLIHPRESYSPEKCGWNQNNQNVWFLADGRSLGLSEFSNPEIRECVVPQGKSLLVQIYGGGCDFSEGWTTEEELYNCVNIGLDTVKFSAKVDGTEVMSSNNRDDYLPDPYLYNITFTSDNIYDAPPGTYKAMANGYFIFLKPLSVGKHTIEFNEAYFKPGFEGQPSSENRLSNVIYNITVK
jgi:hypothetical protein